MKRFFFAFLLLFIFCFGCKYNEPTFSKEPQGQEQYFAQAPADIAPAGDKIAEERPGTDSAKLAPDFTLYDLYQNAYTLSNYRDKQPVLLLFWTTWCPFCRKELKVLNGMYSGLAADGLEVLSLNAGEIPSTVESFVQDYNLAYRVLLDKDNRVAVSYGLIGVPTYILVNKQGEVVFKDNYLPVTEYKDLLERK
jgi:peroxiredoxin